jgi:hypothetical protein
MRRNELALDLARRPARRARHRLRRAGRAQPGAGGERRQAEQPGYYLQDAVITQTQQDGSVGCG